MSELRPPGHNFRVGRTRLEHGYRLVATCKCRHAVSAATYADLNGLINDHYAEIRHQRHLAAEEKAHT